MEQYHNLLRHILRNGEKTSDRTGVGTISTFGYQLRFHLSDGFPLVTTKKIHFKSVVHELLWFLKGDTNTAYLNDNGVSIWNEWANEVGDLGPVYGKQWRSWATSAGEIDQIKELIQGLVTKPYSRRHIVSAWNVGELEQMVLPPCHCLFQFHVSSSGRLSCQLYQRSADAFLGVPFNVASYALLTLMVCQITGYKPGEFIHTFGDAHIYKNHLEQAAVLLERSPRTLPTVTLRPVKDIFSFTYDDIVLSGYDPFPAIKAPVAI